MKIFALQVLLFVIFIPHAGFCQNQNWEEVAPGVWKGVIGNPESLDFLTVAKPESKLDALKALPNEEIPNQSQQLVSTLQDNSVYLRFPLEKEEQLFGFGLNFKTIHQRGRILTLHVDHYGGKDDGRTHAPVPFYVSSRGYGVFINSARYLKIWAGKAVRKDSEKVDIEIRHYGTKDSNYRLYDDDRVTFDYENGDYSWRQISIKKQSSGDFIRNVSPAKTGKPDNIGNITWKQMTI